VAASGFGFRSFLDFENKRGPKQVVGAAHDG
jgi:hypothetical protein